MGPERLTVTIGRSAKTSDFAIDHEGVSNKHCELRFEHEVLTICDVSSNGTGLALPGKTIERIEKGKPLPIEHGCKIALPMTVKKDATQCKFLIGVSKNS